jgi:hypothetical protein
MTALFAAWTWFTGTATGRALLAAGSAIAAAAALYVAGRRSGQAAARNDQLREENHAQRAADQAGADYRSDGGAARRLRDGDF